MSSVTAAYASQKERAAKRSATQSRSARDIGDIPPVADVARRRAAELSLRVFCESYFAEAFHLAWSPDHLKALDAIERVVTHDDTLAIAMPRGSGKTTLCKAATLWAQLNGWSRFAMLIGSSAAHAASMLADLKTWLGTNDLLAADYPEVCHPIRALEGEARRAGGQLHHGRRTHIGWTADQLVLPLIPGAVGAGSVIRVAGIEGNIRGASHTTPDGATLRPTLAIVDDPQTDESARSVSQVQSRLATIQGSIAGLAGPGQRMGIIVPCTVIASDDLADRLLDRQRNPQWQGQRTKLVYRWPDRQDLWDEYAAKRRASFIAGGRGEEATEYYARNREAMDAGAEAAWPERFDPDEELSALQHAMNLKLADAAAFEAEYQNQPLEVTTAGSPQKPEAKTIEAKTVATPRGVVPQEAEQLTAFIDVQSKLLWWMVCSWQAGLGGHVVAYGSWPDQKKSYFTKRDAKRTYARELPKEAFEAQLRHALDAAAEEILGRAWEREDGAEMRVSRCLVDAGWGDSTDSVFQFCRQSAYAAQLMPSKGDGLSARDTPLPDRKPRPGVRLGHHWQIQRPDKRAVQHAFFDTNRWKSLVHRRLRTPVGDPTTLTIHASDRGSSGHRMLADHLTAEYPKVDEKRGRELEIWFQTPNRDNDLLDCLVGCAVAASTLGIEAPADAAPAPKPRQQRRFDISF